MDDVCLGPPCRHFPDWVKTPEDARAYLAYQVLMYGDARAYLAYQVLMYGTAVNYVRDFVIAPPKEPTDG
jgi:hypothetical protein